MSTSTDFKLNILYYEPLRGVRQSFYLSKRSGLKDTNMLLDRSPAHMHDSHQPNGCFWSWCATGLTL